MKESVFFYNKHQKDSPQRRVPAQSEVKQGKARWVAWLVLVRWRLEWCVVGACLLPEVCVLWTFPPAPQEGARGFFLPLPRGGWGVKVLGAESMESGVCLFVPQPFALPFNIKLLYKASIFFFHHHLLFNSFPFSPFFPIFHQMHSCPSHIGLHVTKSNIQVSVLILLDHPAVFDVSEDLILLDTISSVLVTPRSPVFLLFPWLLFSVTFTWYTCLSDLKILESVRTLPSFLFYVDPSATADIAAICDFKDLYAGESLCLHIDISYDFQV